MIVRLDESAIAAIEAILKRGGDVIIRREKRGVLIMEQTRKIIYRNADRIGGQ